MAWQRDRSATCSQHGSPYARCVARKVIVGALIVEHIILVLWFYNLLPSFRVKPPNRERLTCEEAWGRSFSWNVMTHDWECGERPVFPGIPGL